MNGHRAAPGSRPAARCSQPPSPEDATDPVGRSLSSAGPARPARRSTPIRRRSERCRHTGSGDDVADVGSPDKRRWREALSIASKQGKQKNAQPARSISRSGRSGSRGPAVPRFARWPPRRHRALPILTPVIAAEPSALSQHVMAGMSHRDRIRTTAPPPLDSCSRCRWAGCDAAVMSAIPTAEVDGAPARP